MGNLFFIDKLTVTVYNYDCTKEKTENQKKIASLIKEKNINIFWTDKGHSDFEIRNEKMYEIKNKNNAQATELYSNSEIISALIASNIRQVAMYSYNPKLTYREIDKIRADIQEKLKEKLKLSDVYVLETSPILNLYDKGTISAGNKKDMFLGDLMAYKYYGKLLGSVLYDLFLQLPEFKSTLSPSQRQYNYFNTKNRIFLRYYKLLNSDFINHPSAFEVGMVSYYCNIFGNEEYMIDVPFKEYYQEYDNKLSSNDSNPKIESLLIYEDDKKEENNKGKDDKGKFDEKINSEQWMYFKYRKKEDGNFEYYVELYSEDDEKRNLAGKYLPLLHSAIFYEPDFYSNSFPTFSQNDKIYSDKGNEYIEIIYLFRKENFADFNGVSHFAVWRKTNKKINIKKQVKILWEKYYRLAEPKLEATLIETLQKERLKQALQSAIAQVFARNFAHNIGSHVAIRATDKMVKKRIAELFAEQIKKVEGDDKEKQKKFLATPEIVDWLDYMGEKLDLFEVARNEFLAEYNLPAKNVMLYRDVILPFCENTLLMDNIAHSEGVHYKYHCCNKLRIKVLINNVEMKADYGKLQSLDGYNEISYPDNFPYLVKPSGSHTIEEAFTEKAVGENDLEICLTSEHTLYSILENLIRNSAKHNKTELQAKEHLEIIICVKEMEGDNDFYTIQLYDNISKVSQEQLNGFVESITTNLITPEGMVEKKNLGIADIKINAHLLATDAAITEESLSKALTLIYQKEAGGEFVEYEPIENPADVKQYNFGYQFKLCKPKKVIWIGKPENKQLAAKGIICVENKEAFKSGSNNIKEEPLANYQFAILELDVVKELTNKSPNYDWDDFLIKLPHRVLLNCTEDKYKEIENNTDYMWIKELKEHGRIQLANEKIELHNKCGNKNKNWDFDFLKSCWENWLKAKWNISKENKGNLVIYLEDAEMRAKWDRVSSDILNVYSSSNTTPPGKDILIEKDKTTVIYDHHSAGRNNLKVNATDKFIGNYIERDAYFCYDKGSSDYVLLAFTSNKREDKILFSYEAFEAGLKKIIIADERIAEKIPFEDDKFREIKQSQTNEFKSKGEQTLTTLINPNLSDLANNGNIFIINRINEDIEISKYQNCVLAIKEDANKPSLSFIGINSFGKKQFYIDGLVIHRTYMQKLLEGRSTKDQKLSLMNSLYRNFKRIVIVSGGGKPHSMDIPMNFKPYSQLASVFVRYPSKINLNKNL